MRVGIVVGEASGDLLAAGLIEALKERYPTARFEGIAGPRMVAAGCEALYPAELLAVMDIMEILRRYRELNGIRNELARRFIADPPDVFIGVDAPDFNLTLENKLKQAGIPAVHYVSPSVWAWRQYRVRKIARSVDLMLTLFPFEVDFYKAHNVPVTFVGHPLADQIPLETDRDGARRELNLSAVGEVVALLPGSRAGEVRYLADTFIATARWCLEKHPGLRFVVPFANTTTRRMFEQAMAAYGEALPFRLVDGGSQQAMAAADVVVLASGTATLEAALLKRPMVVAHRLAPLTYWVAKRLVKISNVSLPNLLAGKPLVPELLQEDATPEKIGAAVLDILEHPDKIASLRDEFSRMHQTLRQDASRRAAEAVLELIKK